MSNTVAKEADEEAVAGFDRDKMDDDGFFHAIAQDIGFDVSGDRGAMGEGIRGLEARGVRHLPFVGATAQVNACAELRAADSLDRIASGAGFPGDPGSALREAQAHIHALQEHARIGIVTVNRERVIRAANPACEKMFRYSERELRGVLFDRLVHPDDLQSMLRRVKSVTEGDVNACEIESRCRRKDGMRIWGRSVWAAASDGSNRANHFLVLIEDITAQQRLRSRDLRVRSSHRAAVARIANLTRRQREVLVLMMEGHPTKEIASLLGASPKTIDIHRSRVMEKMEADSIAQLVQMILPVRRALRRLQAPAMPQRK